LITRRPGALHQIELHPKDKARAVNNPSHRLSTVNLVISTSQSKKRSFKTAGTSRARTVIIRATTSPRASPLSRVLHSLKPPKVITRTRATSMSQFKSLCLTAHVIALGARH